MPKLLSVPVRDFLDSAFSSADTSGYAAAVNHSGSLILTTEQTLISHAVIALSDLHAHPHRAHKSLRVLMDFADPLHDGYVEVRETSGIPHELGGVKTAEAQLMTAVALLSSDPEEYGKDATKAGGAILNWLDSTLRSQSGNYLSAVSRDGQQLLDDTVSTLNQSLGLWALAKAVECGLREKSELRSQAQTLCTSVVGDDGAVPSVVRQDGEAALHAKFDGATAAMLTIALAAAARVLEDDSLLGPATKVMQFADTHLWDPRFNGYWDHCDLDGKITVHREFITLLNSAIPIKTSRTNAWLAIASAHVHGENNEAMMRAARYLRTLHDDHHQGCFIGEGYFWTPPGNPVGPFERLMLPSRRTAGISYFGASSFLRLYNKFPESQALASWAFFLAGTPADDPLPQAAARVDRRFQFDSLPAVELTMPPIARLEPVDMRNIIDQDRHIEVITAAYTPRYGFGWTHRRSPLGSQPDRTPSVFGTHHSIANLKVLGGTVPDADHVARWLRSTQSAAGMFGEYPGGPADVLNTYLAINALDLLGTENYGNASACVEHVQACQNADGGFGVVPGFISDLFHTNLAIVALHTLDAQPIDPQGCVNYLLRASTGDGGYGQRVGTPADVYSIYRATGTLNLLGYGLPDQERAVDWLRRAQGPGGGFRHDTSSRESLIATYHAVAALFLLGSEPADPGGVVAWLRTCQTAEGTFSNIPGVSSGTIDEAFAAVQSLAILANGLDPYFAILVS